MFELHRGDCLDVLRTLPDASVGAVFADPPYGTTHLTWDRPIPLAPLWEQLRRVVKPDAAIVLFGAQPFTSELVLSNRDWFKYCWCWRKSICGGVFNAGHRPLKNHEDIAVFSPAGAAPGCRLAMKYRPQGLRPGRRTRRQGVERDSAFVSSRPSHPILYRDRFSGYPRSVLEIGNHNGGGCFPGCGERKSHKTGKPVALMDYLVRTYSDPGDTVLDFAMGSGSTGVAAVAAGRRFVGIEIDPESFAVAGRRFDAAMAARAEVA